VFLALLVLLAFAKDDNNDNKDNDVQRYEYSSNGCCAIEVKSKLGDDFSWEYSLSAKSNPVVEARIRSKNGKGNERSRFMINFKRMFEYVPSNVALGFQEFKDTIVKQVENFNIQSITDLTPTNVNTKTYQFLSNDSSFELLVHINIQNTTKVIDPRDVKIDVIVNVDALKSEGWLQTSTNRIGLKVQIFTSSDVDDGDDHNKDDNKKGVKAKQDAGNNYGALDWIDYVMCNNGSNKVKVLATKQVIDADEKGEDDNEKVFKIFFTLNDDTVVNGGSCIWDPVVGFRSDAIHVIFSLFLLVIMLFI